MKTAIYIEDGVEQIVLTPENDFEKSIVKGMADKENNVEVFEGAFYDCRGGWVRQNKYYQHNPSFGETSNEMSLIIKRSHDS